LLLIPSIVFVTVLAVFVRRTLPNKPAAAVDENTVFDQEKKIAGSITVGSTSIQVSLANNEIDRRKGLSGVGSLPEGRGMLFVFPQENIRPTFWMKDMNISLDMIWINDGKVTQIYENVPPPASGTPDSALDLYIPNDPIDYILEVNAGFSAQNNIKVGDTVDLSQVL
jgi:hypothetical protein